MDLLPEFKRFVKGVFVQPRRGRVTRFGFEIYFEVQVAFVADGDVSDAAGFTEYSIVG